MYDPGDITGLLNRWTTGDPEAGDRLAPLIYSELHRLAERIFRGEHHGHTLQPTALVNEVFEKLVSVDVAWQDRAHFFALAARMMRRLLVDYARLRNSRKRGGDALKVTFDESQLADADRSAELIEFDEVLTALAEFDERKADLIQLQYFAGLTFSEMTEVTGLSSTTLDRELRLARAWMRTRLSAGTTSPRFQ
jgi:RNA polymerase sigma factor (TIGR02999 family)